MSEFIKLKSKVDGAEFSALHAQAQGRRRAGVILIQEIFGIDKYMRADTERWSAAGYEVLTPSMFDRQEPGFVADHDEHGRTTGKAYLEANGWVNPLNDIDTCMDFLKPRGLVFLVGYCYGGTLAWLAACRFDGLAAASGYYGGRIVASGQEVPRCPIVLHFGRDDASIPVGKIEEWARTRPELAVNFYEGAGHGFNNADGAAAKLARQRTMTLFENNGAM